MDCRWVPWAVVLAVATPGMVGAQSAPTASPQKRPNAVERPWTTTPGSPYDRAQAVAAERVRQRDDVGQVDAGPTFPLVEAPPSELPLGAGVPATAQAVRPSVAERPWTDGANPPYDRAQAVAAERLRPDAALHGASPYPDRYRTPVPAPFRPPAATTWRGGMLYPGLPFPPIRGWRTAQSRW